MKITVMVEDIVKMDCANVWKGLMESYVIKYLYDYIQKIYT